MLVNKFENLRILITGGGTGLGVYMVKQLYEEGMKVICISKEYDYIFPSNILTFQGDIFDDNFLEDAISNILEEVGGIDVLINNIGYGVNSLMENQTEEELENMFRLNVASHLRMVKRCVNLGNLKRVINIASTYAKVTFPTLEVYAATKRATLMLTRSLAKDAIGESPSEVMYSTHLASSSTVPLPTFPLIYGSQPSISQRFRNSCVPKLLSSIVPPQLLFTILEGCC